LFIGDLGGAVSLGRRNRFVFWSCIVLGACFGVLATHRAHAQGAENHSQAAAQTAQSNVVAFDISAGRLSTALREISHQSGVPITFQDIDVANYAADAIQGSLTVSHAIERALKNTALRADQSKDGTIVVALIDTIPVAQAPDSVSPDATKLETVTVTGWGKDYLTDTASGATRTDTPLIETPQTVTVINRQQIEDQQARSLEDLLEDQAGLTVNGERDANGGNSYNLRGFTVENSTIDGQTVQGDLSNDQPLIGVESVEIIKGPDSIMGGSGSRYGGVINIVTKKPSPKRQAIIVADWGTKNYNTRTLGLDLGGGIGFSDRLLFRFVGSTEYARQSRSGYTTPEHDVYFAPSLGWRSGGTNIVFGYEQQRRQTPFAVVTTSTSTELTSTPIRINGAPDDSSLLHRKRWYFDFSQKLDWLGTDWTLHTRGHRARNLVDGKFWLIVGSAPVLAPEQGWWVLTADKIHLEQNTDTILNDLVTRFDTWGIHHTTLLGADFLRTPYVVGLTIKGAAPFNTISSPPLPPVDSLPTNVDVGALPLNLPLAVTASEKGFLFQDQIAYGQHWRLVGSVRRAFYRDDTGNPPTRKTLPNGGIVFLPVPWVSIYGSRLQTYTPRTGEVDQSGMPLPPEEGTQLEAGIKMTPIDDLAVTASWFDITVSNSAHALPGGTFELGPGAISKGIEFDLTGKIIDGLNVSATYTHAKQKLNLSSAHTSQTFAGDRPLYTPDTTYSLFAIYRVQSTFLKGLMFSAGLHGNSSDLGGYSDQNTNLDTVRSALDSQVPGGFSGEQIDSVLTTLNPLLGTQASTTKARVMHNPAQYRVDASIGYEFKYGGFQFQVKNLENKQLYSTASSNYAVYPYPGREYHFTVRLKAF
jgi:iron complex outermembrane receptor protein